MSPRSHRAYAVRPPSDRIPCGILRHMVSALRHPLVAAVALTVALACCGREPTHASQPAGVPLADANVAPVVPESPEVLAHLVPGAPAVTEPIDLVRDIERHLNDVTDRATAMDKRIAIDGRMLALRKKLPDWEHPHGAVREMLAKHGDEGIRLADRVRAKAEAMAKDPEITAILGGYLQQVQDLLK